MRMTFLLLILLFFYHHQEIEAGKSKFLKGLKKIGDKLFGKKTQTNADNLSKPASNTKPTQVAPTIHAPTIQTESSTYAPQIRNPHAGAGISVAASTISTQPASYKPPIRSSPLGTHFPGGKGQGTPPLQANTKPSTLDHGQAATDAAVLVAATDAAQKSSQDTYNPFSVSDPGSPELFGISGSDSGVGISIPTDFSSLGVGVDGGGGGGGGDGTGTNILTDCLCAIGGCIGDILKACDPTACCCCIS